METRRTHFAVRFLPSLTDFAFLMPMAFLFGRMDGVKTLLSDCDTGWHIRTGEWIAARHAVPTADVFSFSRPGGTWYAWEWLADLVMAGLNSRGGLATVVLFSLLLICFTYTLLYRLVRRKSNCIVAIFVTMVAAAASSIHWLARPHLFTLFFLVLFCWALEEVRDGRTRLRGVPYLALLPLATVVWTNLHGGFFVGIVMIGAYGMGEVLGVLLAEDRARRDLRRAVPYFLCALACLAASLVNPYGYRLHAHMLQYLLDPYNSLHIMEFLSPSFHHPTAIFFECMLVLGVTAALWHGSRRRFAEPLILVLWAHAGLLAARNIPIYMLAAAGPVAAAIEGWLGQLPRAGVARWLRAAARTFNGVAAEMGAIEKLRRWHWISAAAALGVAALVYAPHPPAAFRAEFDPKTYPAAALEVLRRYPTARIFTHDEWGDYLIWTLYPGHKVFVDGRSDFYGDDFGNRYLEILGVHYDWEKTLAGFGVDTILMPPGAPLSGALKESSRWHVVYDDGIALVFRSTQQTAGEAMFAARPGGAAGRDREVTKTEARDSTITGRKPRT